MLNKFIPCLLLFSTISWASVYQCQEVEVKSLVVKGESEKVSLCFHPKDDTYFISQNCLSLDCKSLLKIKTTKSVDSNEERPGKTKCRAMGGSVEKIEIPSKGERYRCLFTEDGSSISLNLLESWDGTKFSGPQL